VGVRTTLPINPFKRLAKQNSCKRISQKACELLTKYSEEYAISLIKIATELAKNSNRTTILERDIEQAKNMKGGELWKTNSYKLTSKNLSSLA
jgi:histone H3/H4